MRLYRFEAFEQGHNQEGIYQVVDPYLINDYSREANLLPCPKLEDLWESVSFWFTEEGWEEYGKYLLLLISEPGAWQELEQCDTHIILYIIDIELEDYGHYLVDQYQIALSDEDREGWYEMGVELTPDNVDEIIIDNDLWEGW